MAAMKRAIRNEDDYWIEIGELFADGVGWRRAVNLF